MFEPIAIVGRGALFPGAAGAIALGDLAARTHVAISPAPRGRCDDDGGRLLSTVSAPLDGMLHDIGGYVQAAPPVADFLSSPMRDKFNALDPLFGWTLHCSTEALTDAGFDASAAPERAGLIMGNLSFPTEAMARRGEFDVLDTLGLRTASSAQTPAATPHALNRFMSGLPARLTAEALDLDGPAFCLDAACASSLYALRFACDVLARRECDVMLAGAVNRADPLFIHAGFTALSALSPTGRSRPFADGADGLIPGEGCGVACLMRLADAEREGRTIHGVIRGVGLSNDGRAKNLLAPSSEGQVRALRSAYAMADCAPRAVGMMECHATGTPLGDKVEIETLRALFDDAGRDTPLPIGSLKGNIGHLITAAGIAGVFKVLESFRREAILPSVDVERQSDSLRDAAGTLRLQTETAPFVRGSEPRLGAVSAFGFGGNNAHLLVEQYEKATPRVAASLIPSPPDLVVVAAGLRAGQAEDLVAFEAGIRRGHIAGSDAAAFDAGGLRFPPNDIADSLPQQILMLEAARDAAAALDRPTADGARGGDPLAGPRTGIYIGMGCDADVTTPGLRWRLPLLGDFSSNQRDDAGPCVTAAHVLGQMPNIPANRLSAQLDARGPGFTVSAETLSGIAALSLARDAIANGEIDVALVGATDVHCPIRDRAPHHAAHTAADRFCDGAIALVVTTTKHAAEKGWPTLFTVDALDAAGAPKRSAPPSPGAFTAAAGHNQAALGLFEAVASAVLGHDAPTVLTDQFGGCAMIKLTADASWAATAAQQRGARPRRFMQQKPMHRSFAALAHKEEATEMAAAPPLVFASAHNAAIKSAPVPTGTDAMPPAPRLLRIAAEAPSAVMSESAAPPPVSSSRGTHPLQPVASTSAASPTAPTRTPSGSASTLAPDALTSVLSARADLAAAHKAFVEEAARAQQAFLDVHGRFAARLTSGAPVVAAPLMAPPATTPPPAPRVAVPPVAPLQRPTGTPTTPDIITSVDTATPRPVATAPVSLPVARPADADDGPPTGERLLALRAQPWLDRAALERVASDKISSVLGEVFTRQDVFPRQVRMPEPPLLLTDRVLWTDATPGVLEQNRTMVTESDVTWDKWYVQDGRIPASILIESGQSDLLLISYMGVDFENKGERTYRLLGCDLTYGDALPAVGDTLHYDIHIDGFANHGATKIFFFHSDCRIGGPDGPVVLSVREGQAGFFSDEELAGSGGILWKPSDVKVESLPPHREAPVKPNKTSLDDAALDALAAGDVYAAFGEGFEATAPHVRTPSIPDGDMKLIDRVDVFEPDGGPWGRGYLRGALDLTGDNWFFPGHFKDDPCMPGTIMFEGCLQMLRLAMVGTGRTLDKDGWRFEPVGQKPYRLRCRGQATPKSRDMVYEVFIREFVDGEHPQVVADILVTVDGLKGLHCEQVALRLVPDVPLTSYPELLGHRPKHNGHDAVGGVGHPRDEHAVISQRALLATGWGKPSEAFPNLYEPYDGGARVPRLPGPPYHFMSRVEKLTGPETGAFKPGNEVTVAYDVPRDAWFFDDTPTSLMPFSVLLEVALQPCGWLSSYTGSILKSDIPLYYRNLDGHARIERSISRDVGTLRTWARLDNISHSAGMMIQNFTLNVQDDDGVLFDGTTVFGFFPHEALAHQLGTGSTDAEKQALQAAAFGPDVSGGVLETLYAGRLNVIDRVTHFAPTAGRHGLGRVIAEKDIGPTAWFFKAHFFQDPVQPGSLGIEAMLQTLRYWCAASGFGDAEHLLPIAKDAETTWKYRGQVIPRNKLVQVELEISEISDDAVFAEAWLWVDGLRIYHAPRIGLSRR